MYRHMVRFMPYNIRGMGNVLVFEILTTIKLVVLSQNILCCRYSKQHRVIDANFKLHGEL